MLITKEMRENFKRCLGETERSERTVEKYDRDARRFMEFVGDEELTKAVVVRFKERLRQEMSPVSANSILAAVNCFLKFPGHPEFCVRAFKIQRRLFSPKASTNGLSRRRSKQ